VVVFFIIFLYFFVFCLPVFENNDFWLRFAASKHQHLLCIRLDAKIVKLIV